MSYLILFLSQDAHTDSSGLLHTDQSQDYTLDKASVSPSHMSLTFHRDYDTCDDDDYIIDVSTYREPQGWLKVAASRAVTQSPGVPHASECHISVKFYFFSKILLVRVPMFSLPGAPAINP